MGYKLKAIWQRDSLVKNKDGLYDKENIKVIIMAISGDYAMIRRPNSAPFTISIKDLIIKHP